MERPVGVLALQGGFAAHQSALARLGIASTQVREADQLCGLRGLVIPGGESTTMLTLMQRGAMFAAVAEFGFRGRPVLATCAGVILAANGHFGWLDVDVRRNAYGTQSSSSVVRSDDGAHELVLIRAPKIERVGAQVEVLAQHRGAPMLVRQGTVVGATFHPELTRSSDLHATLFACR